MNAAERQAIIDGITSGRGLTSESFELLGIPSRYWLKYAGACSSVQSKVDGRILETLERDKAREALRV